MYGLCVTHVRLMYGLCAVCVRFGYKYGRVKTHPYKIRHRYAICEFMAFVVQKLILGLFGLCFIFGLLKCMLDGLHLKFEA